MGLALKTEALSPAPLADDFVEAIRSLPSTDERHAWAMHEVCGLDRSVSMQVVGQISGEKFAALQKADLRTTSIGWPETLHKEDREHGKLYGFDPHAAVAPVADIDFAEFGVPDKCADFTAAFADLFPALGKISTSIEAFAAYYANAHIDHNEDCRAQLILVLENEAGHRLLSIDEAGEHHLLVPKPGELVMLDNRCKHAVLSDQSGGIDHMRAHPMKGAFLLIDDHQPDQDDNPWS